MKEADKLGDDIKAKQASLDEMRNKLIQLAADTQVTQREINEKIVELGKDEFGKVDVTNLLLTGSTTHESSICGTQLVIKTLTKKETLAIDKLSKNYFEDAAAFYSNSIMVDTLTYAIISYGGHKTLLAGDDTFAIAKDAVLSLSDEVLMLIWNKYNRLNRFLRAYLELNLKN